jgi:Tol biopolymer transport system component
MASDSISFHEEQRRGERDGLVPERPFHPIPSRLLSSCASLLACAVPAFAQTTSLISGDASGLPGAGDSYRPEISADGRYVVFSSAAANLVANDTNGTYDVFVRDRATGTTTRVSTSSGGVEADAQCLLPKISPTGRWVGFDSAATNLVANDANGHTDVFVKDLATGVLTRESVTHSGGDSDGDSYVQAISSDGHWLVFSSLATNLVANDTNGWRDLFLRDRWSGVTTRCVMGLGGTEPNGLTIRAVMSADARFIAFESRASNLVAGDTNNTMDVFVLDRDTGVIERESVGPAGQEGDGENDGPSISGDGRYVGFASYSTNLWPNDANGSSDVFLRDRTTGAVELISRSMSGGVPNADSHLPAISFNGRFVAFNSMASDVVPGDTNNVGDVFVIDRTSSFIHRVSVATGGGEGNGLSIFPVITWAGNEVAFESNSTSFAANDANGVRDVFVATDVLSDGALFACVGGFDGVIACPCANPAIGHGRGCDNSAATGGAQIVSSGVASLSQGTLVFTTNGETASATSIVLQGDAFLASGAVFGQGVRCTGGTLKRLYVKIASGGSITAPQSGDASVNARSAALGDVIAPGSSRWYAVYYRDPNVLGGCPASSTFNITQTQEQAWVP